MAVVIRLKTMGTKKKIKHRVVVTDSKFPRNGRFLEEVGYWDPSREPANTKIKLGETAEIPVTRYVRMPPRGAPAGTPPRNPIEVLAVGGGTNLYWSGGDFSHVVSTSIDKWR